MSTTFPVVREPSPAELNGSRMADYMAWLAEHGYGAFDDYAALYDWSIADIARFWGSIWHYTGVIARESYREVLADRRMPGAEWFSGARLNFAENLLREALRGEPAKPAITAVSETRATIRHTYGELLNDVAACREFLRQHGVAKGDRVAGVVANTPEAIIAMLATTSLGAIWSSASPDFGLNGLFDRFGQIEPKVLVAVNGYGYGGEVFDRRETVAQLSEKMPSLGAVVMIANVPSVGLSEAADTLSWDAALAAGHGAAPAFEQVPFDHPVYIVYSSGTTGVPKCIVHGGGGTLLQHSKELMLHGDVRATDTLFYYTTTGWMMWNWLVSGLITGAELVLYEGSPSYPDLDVLWALAETEGITHFGTSAKFLGGCRKQELAPGNAHDLSALRIIFSTGSPLLPEDYDYVYTKIKSDVLLGSISGGTDIVSCFVGCCPLLPVRRGEIQCKLLGMDVKAFNDSGEEVLNERGELVCTQPAPCMPVMFWNDPDGARYRQAYFDKYPGVWAHGDLVSFSERGGCVIYGRSDATLNPGGVRIGTAEIYRQVETITSVVDSIVVGQPWREDVRVVLLVVLAEGHTLNDELIQRIAQRIRAGASPRHVPKRIVAVSQIPYTRSGKKMEVAVRKVLSARDVENREAIANPESLEEIGAIQALFE